MLMGWCRHRGVSLEDFLEWVWQGKEDTPERRARYSQDWRAWGEKRPPNNKQVERVLMTLYPETCFTNKDARIYRQTHSLETTRIVTGLSKPRGQMFLEEKYKRQNIIEEGPKFLGIDDFGKELAVLFHVPMGRTKRPKSAAS
jgi:hypothetical protein